MSAFTEGSLDWAKEKINALVAAAAKGGGNAMPEAEGLVDSNGNISGFLMKKGEDSFFGGSSMKRRHFRLRGKMLSYYVDDKESTKPKGSVDLNAAFNVEVTNEKMKNGPLEGEIYLTVHTPDRIWVLCGPLEHIVPWAATLKSRIVGNTKEAAKVASDKRKAERKQQRMSNIAFDVFQKFSRFAIGGGNDLVPPGTTPAEQFELTFDSGPLYLDLVADDDDNIMCSGFAETESGEPGPAEQTGKILAGDYLLACNDNSFERLKFYDAIDVIRGAPYPKTFLFERPPVEPTPDREGWAGKRGEQPGSAYRRRFFKLYGDKLFYYKPQMKDLDEPSDKPSGCIELSSIDVIQPITVRKGLTYSRFRLEMDTGTRVWALGFLDAEEMTSWGKSLAEKCGKGADALKDVKKLEPGQEGGDVQPITFMLSLIVPDGAGPGSVLEVQDPYGRKIRITVPEDLDDDRKMSVPVEAPEIDDQAPGVESECLRRCWFTNAERPRYASLYSDRIVLRRSHHEEDAEGTPIFFGELAGINQEYSSSEKVGRLLLQSNSGDVEVLSFNSKHLLDEWHVALSNVLMTKYPHVISGLTIEVPESPAADVEEDLDDDDVDDVYSGWMWKKGEVVGLLKSSEKSAFRRRWFALRHNNLMYFKYQKSDRGYGTGNHDTAGRAGIIDMSTVQNVKACFDDNSPDNCIALQAVNRTYYLVVPGLDDDFDEWLERLQTAADVYGGEQGAEAFKDLKAREAAAETARVDGIRANIKKQGILTINTASNFFVVDAEAIAYYRNESDVYDASMDSQGSMSLLQIQSVRWPSISTPSNFSSFDVAGLTRTWEICAPNEEEAKAWVRLVAKATGRIELEDTPTSIQTVDMSGNIGNRMLAFKKTKAKGKKKKIGGRAKKAGKR